MKKRKKDILWLLPFVLLLALIPFLFQEEEEFPMDEPLQYTEQIYHAASHHGINPFLLAAVARVESSWQTDIHSPAGARGLMQIMPATALFLAEERGLEFEVEMLDDPSVSLDYGAYYLKKLYDKYGRWEETLAAYNAGPGNVDQWLEDETLSKRGRLIEIPFEETKEYVEKVQLYQRYYKKRYGSFPKDGKK